MNQLKFIMKRETWKSFLVVSFSFRSSYDDLTRILLINWISITIYGSFGKIARNQWNKCGASSFVEWSEKNPLKELLHLLVQVGEYRFLLNNVIIYEKNSVKNCMCHKSWCTKQINRKMAKMFRISFFSSR